MSGRSRLAASRGLLLALAGLALAVAPARPPDARAFAMRDCVATGAGAAEREAGSGPCLRGDPGAGPADAERARRDRDRWEAEHRAAGERTRVLDAAARFRAERERLGMAPPAPEVPSPVSRAPCSRPEATGECTATSEQILYQIQRSRAAAGAGGVAALPGR